MNHLITTRKGKNSWSPLAEFRNEMDNFFDGFWGLSAPVNNPIGHTSENWQPVCDLVEEQDHYLLNLEIPGIPKDQIKIEIQDQQLVIKGERKAEEIKNEKGIKYTERHYGSFLRSFTLPSGFDADKIEADYQEGVLRILIPKVDAAKPRQIKIGTGNSASFFGKLMSPSSTKEKIAS